jgi:hypothetical protein
MPPHLHGWLLAIALTVDLAVLVACVLWLMSEFFGE